MIFEVIKRFDPILPQVTFAHVGVSAFNVEMGEFSYTPELAMFAENKNKVEGLDSQLEMFKGEK